MTKPHGMFFLQTAEDLFRKLQWDREQLIHNPLDASACFNFFVTAEHLPEWIHAGDQQAAKKMREQEPLLRICSQLANGAKHFETKNKKHRSVVATAVHSIVSLDTPGANQAEEFVVELSPDEAQLLGTRTVGVTALARQIVDLLQLRLLNSSVPHP